MGLKKTEHTSPPHHMFARHCIRVKQRGSNRDNCYAVFDSMLIEIGVSACPSEHQRDHPEACGQ